MELATFAGGCFWCTEAIFKRLKGVKSVVSGYAGGDEKKANYDDVSMGYTNHAEAIQIEFDPKEISFDTLVKIFFHTHNPTTLNQQGADVGTQYRSAIFYHNKNQKELAESEMEEYNKDNPYKKKAVTEILPFVKFFKAEDYHQNYYERNQDQPYCTIVIDPKVNKLLKDYSSYVKNEYLK